MKRQGIAVLVIVLGWLAFLALTSVAYAQEYRLGPDDVLTVTVLRHPELSADQVTVTQDGKINLPVAGEVTITGKTAAEASQAIASALKSRLVSPEVTVAIKQARPERVFVLGAVGHPGIFDLKPGWRVTEALAAAGGLTVRPELAEASILRLNKETIAIDLPAILTEGEQPANVALQAGDVLSVTERTVRISVAGQVQRPGAYDLPAGGGVVEAVALAGGVAQKAALTRVTVKHADGTMTNADLFKVMVLGDMQANLKLHAGDLVMVPESKARVAVLGAVRMPGYFDIEEGTAPRTTDLVAMAGGADKHARISQVAIMRMVNNQATRINVDLEKVLRQGRSDEDQLVRSGDVIYVPDAKVDWEMAMRAIASLGTFGWLMK